MGSIDIPTFLRDKIKPSQPTEIEGNAIDVPYFLKKKVGVGSNGLPTTLDNGLSGTPKDEVVIKAEPIKPTEPIEASLQADELSKRTKKQYVAGGELGSTEIIVPDEEAKKEAQLLRDEIKVKYGYDADELASEHKGLKPSDYGREGFGKEELLIDKNENPQLYQRKLGRLKWQSGFESVLADNLVNGHITSEEYNGINNAIQSSLENASVGDYVQQRENINYVANAIKQYGGLDKDKILKDYAVEVGKVYGNSYKSLSAQKKQETPESKFLNPDAELGLQYLRDIDPEKAKQYDRLFVDPKKLEGDALKGYNHLMQTLEETSIGLQDNAVTEDLNNLSNIAKRNNGLTPEQLEQAKILEAKKDEIEKKKLELDQKYPDRIEDKIDDAVQEVLGQRLGWGNYAGGMTGKAIKNTAQGIWESVSEPFMSDASNSMRELAIMGESLGESKLYNKTDANKSFQTDQLIFKPELQAEVDLIKNDKSLTREQKEAKLYPLLKENKDDFGRVPIQGGKFNVSPSSILYGVTDIGTTLLPFIGLEALTGGIGGAGTAARFLRTFTAAAATSFHDEYANAISEGKPQSEAYKQAMGMTAITSAGMAGAGTAEKVRAFYGSSKSSASKIIKGMSDDQIEYVLDAAKLPKVLKPFLSIGERGIATPKMFAKGAKTGAEFELAMGLANEAKHQIYDTPIDREQNFKQSLLGIANFGLLGAGLGHIGYKSPTELQKSGFSEMGKNPEEFHLAAKQMLKDGQLTKQEFDHRTLLIDKSAEAQKTLPKANAKGKPLSEKEQSDYIYNSVIKNEGKKAASNLPPVQAEKAEHTALVADFKNDLILEPKTDAQLESRENALEKVLEPKKDADGKTIELNEKVEKEAKAELQAINEVIQEQKQEEQPQPEVKSQEITFENAKEGDVINHNGESVTIVSKGKSRGGNDIVTVKKEPLKKTEKELELDAANTVYGRHSSEYGVKGATVEEIKKNHWGEFNNALNDARKVQESQKPSEYTIDKEQWDNEVKSEPKPQPEVKSEKELEQEERDSVFNVPLSEVGNSIDALMQKEKDKPDGFGAFIEKRDARETKEVAEKYLSPENISDAELKKDFSDALRGNPTTWYADGLKLRESLKEATNRGIDTTDMLKEAVKVYTDAGYSIETAKSVVANMLKPIFEGSKKVETDKSKLIPEPKPAQTEVIEPSTEVKSEEVGLGEKPIWKLTQDESYKVNGDFESEEGLISHDEMAAKALSNLPNGKSGITKDGNKVIYRDENGKPIGYAIIDKNGIREIGVDEKSRSKGVASKIINWLKDEGITDKLLPPFSKEGNILSHRNEVKKAILEGRYEKAIANGEMTFDEANKIIKSAGLEVPKDIQELAKSENKPIQNEQAKESKVPGTEKKASPTTESVSKVEQPTGEAKKDIGTKARELAAKLESGEKSVLPSWMKAKLPPGTKYSGIDIDKAYANALRAFAEAHDKYKDFKKAIEEGFKHIRDWFKENGIPIDEAEMKDNFEKEVVGKGEIGITHAQTKEIREEQGFDLYEKDPKKVAEWDAEAKKRIKEGKLPDLISKMERGEDISAVEQRMMGFHIANLNEEVAKNPSNENISALRHAVELSDIVGGRQAGQALVARKGTFLPDNSLGSWIIQRMESLGVDELTPKQKEEIQKQFDEYDAKAKKADELLAKANEEISRLKAENEVFKTKKEERKKDQATLKVERNDILTSIKEKWKGAGKETLSLSVPYAQQLIAIAPDVAKLTKNLVYSGVIKLADVIDNIHDVLKTIEPNIKKEDVRDLIAGVYNEPKPPKSALERALRDVRDEAKLIKRLEDLINGVKASERKQIERNQEITELKNKIKDFKKENPDLEGQLKNIKKRNEAAEKALLERIKNKDFETKKPIPFNENTALKKANPKLYKETMDAIVAKDEARHKFDLAKRQDELDKRSKIRKVFDFGGKLISTSKAIKAGIDDSVTFVQLGMAVLANPKSGIKAKIEAIKDINNNRFKRQLAALHNSPNWDTIKNSGLDITEPKSLTKENVEELYSGNLLDQPIMGKNLWTYSGGIFERLFTSMGNNMRLNLFNKRMEYLENQGKTFDSHPQEYKDAARVINELTGRGKVQPNLQAAMPVISPIIWAPKMLASSLNLLGITDLAALPTGRKGLYRSITPQQRAYALTQMGKGIGMGVAVMGALAMAGWSVDYDPRSSTFGTVKHGTTTYNVFGRYAGVVKILVQIITGKKETAFGETDLDEKGGRGTVLGKFTRGKMTPAAGIAYDYVFNSQKNTFTKEPINLQTLPNELLTPISVNDVKKGFEQDGSMSLLTRWLPAVEGIQVMDDRDFKNTHLFTKEEIDSQAFKPLKDKGIDLPSMGTVKQHKIDVDSKHPNQAEKDDKPYGLMTDAEFKQFNDTKKKYLKKEIELILKTEYPHTEIKPSGLDKQVGKVLGKNLPKYVLKEKIETATKDITKRILEEMFPIKEGKIEHEYKSEDEIEKEKIELEKQLENN